MNFTEQKDKFVISTEFIRNNSKTIEETPE